MKMIGRTLVFLAVLSPLLVHGDDAVGASSNDRVGLYRVDLVCPAASSIGCGSVAKPLLLELERSTNVSEAWLNRAGTVIAVIWKNGAREKRVHTLGLALENRTVAELKGEAREKMLKAFSSGNGWYRGADVDRLSEEEAGIIAGRLVRRIGEQIALSADKSKALKAGITAVMKRKLISGEIEGRNHLEEEILNVCQQELSDNDIAILRKAREKGAFSNLRDD
jgi:hypothetical protein